MDKSAEKKKTYKHIERVTIGDAFKDKLTRLKDQAMGALRGISSITRSDIVNLLIDEHPDELSVAQIDKLKATHIDQVKYAFWIAQRLKAARDAGENVTLQDLIRQQPLLPTDVVKRRKRSQRKKEPAVVEDHTTTSEHKRVQSDI